MKTLLLLGSGELGKEFVISVKRLGHRVVAVDSYQHAPAMQVADDWRVVNMLDPAALDAVIDDVQPDIIVPEIEAIRTERLFAYESRGIHVVPSARAANYTMNRKAIRDLASRELGVKTARYAYASTETEFMEALADIGIPCVVKPLMSSSGKGQSTVRSAAEAQRAWTYAMEGSRGDLREVIVEEFIPFESEITLLTVTQHAGPTMFCPPIGHRQERGDYQESWQPHSMPEVLLRKAEAMAERVTKALGGAGLWGVEFFLTSSDVYFSELSPRPHDTGMVTLAGSQTFTEFELHARAILGLPIPSISVERVAASAVVLASEVGTVRDYQGLEQALCVANTDVRLFGKPSTRPYRRMGVALAWDSTNASIDSVRKRARESAASIHIVTAESTSE
ncbi:MAG: formate-dependent phosphoribosylglycinamide formyltransferase [Candidatus Kapabacteria bacterium]|nr:formate-dependent phosphoribosylglycinamide formyltransferase [Candidatus Kapabacteria bacterium]